MDKNYTTQLHQSALNNEILIAEVDEFFNVFANNISADSSDSADNDLKELINLVEIDKYGN